MTHRLPPDGKGVQSPTKQGELQHLLAPMPCPACSTPIDALAAAGVTGESSRADGPVSTQAFRCPHCHAELARMEPPAGTWPGWYWRLDHVWLRRLVAKAREFDRIVLSREQSGGQDAA